MGRSLLEEGGGGGVDGDDDDDDDDDDVVVVVTVFGGGRGGGDFELGLGYCEHGLKSITGLMLQFLNSLIGKADSENWVGMVNSSPC
ncbi:hypothetical protein D915_003350 [Fasciola hepatica]|uniref:Uncharacterized protein n=1 Tax=Fasciola hepatica TaxID=6192 RepID=A0A4E0RE20_FASHE|nr:hypothetical protein D915_003350 [Fasciola hepatica]